MYKKNNYSSNFMYNMDEDLIMRRKIDQELLIWKLNENHKPLIIEGARQVGKTFSVLQFINKNYAKENTILLNFIEDKSLSKIFEDSIEAQSIINKLSLLFREKKLVERKSIIFLDEIQACPRAITALKSLSTTKIDIIATGSLLGVSYASVDSFPVGYIERMILRPFDFEEFLWALDISEEHIRSLKLNYIDKKPIDSFIHDLMNGFFINYIIVGGMPEAVKTYNIRHNFDDVFPIQKELLESYRDDIAKYTDKKERAKARECFDSIPRQLGRDNKKFQYKLIKSGARSAAYDGSIQWLIDAGILLKVYNLVQLAMPLSAYKKSEAFKLYVFDTGILMAMLGSEIPYQLSIGNLDVFNGALFENCVATQLACNHNDMYYFERNSSLEIDYVLESKVGLIGIDVKASYNTKAKSLKTLLKENEIDIGIILSKNNISKKEKIIDIPTYLAMLL